MNVSRIAHAGFGLFARLTARHPRPGAFRFAAVLLLLFAAACLPAAAAAQDLSMLTTLSSFDDNDNSGNVTLGDVLHYTLTATNTGSVQLTNVQVSDDFGALLNCGTLAVNATCTTTSSHTVTAADVAGGQVLEDGAATSNETDVVENILYTRVFGNQMTIFIEESDNGNSGGSGPTAGDVLHYRVLVTNQNATGNLTNVHVSDPTLSPSTSLTCATLAPGAVCELDGDYTITPADVSNGFVTNNASATSDQVPGGVSYSVSRTVSGSSTNFRLFTTAALTSNADNDHSGTVTVGDVLTITETAVNNGNATLTNVVVTDPLLTPSSSNPCTSVAVGASCSFTGTHTVTTADASAGQIVFDPSATSTETSGNNDHGIPLLVPVATASGAAMSVIMDITGIVDVDHSGTLTAGDTAQFVVTAINVGTIPLTNVQVSNPQTTPNTFTCASVAVGATCVLNRTYTLQASQISTSMKITVTGSATSTQVPGPVSLIRDFTIDDNSFPGASLQVVAGNGQTGAPGTTLPTPLTVRLLGPNNTGLPGYTISFLVLSGNGQVSTVHTTTDGNGQASTSLTLPATPGVVTVLACENNDRCGPDVLFTATAAVPAVPAALTIVSGNNQTLPINTTSAPLVVQLMNNNAPVANATITWTGTNATPLHPTSITDANGRASITATVTNAGAATVSASSASPAAGPVSFALNGGLASQPGLTPQQVAVATTLDNACPALTALSNPTPAQADLLAQCQALASAQNSGQIGNALNQMLPHDTLIQSNASVLVSSAQFDNIKARMQALRSGAHGGSFGGLAFTSPDGSLQFGRYGDSALGLADADKKSDDSGGGFDRWGFFASGSFGWGSADPRAAAPGYGFHTNGLTAGADYRFNDNWVLGMSAGYARYSSSVDNVGGGLDTHGWSISGYTTIYQKNNWYVDGVLTWGSNTYDIDRRVIYTLGTTTVNQAAHSSSGGDTVAGALTFGRDFNHGPWLFGPYFRGTYSHTSFDGYQETLSSGSGSGLGLAVDSRSLKSVTTVLGAKLNYTSSQSWGVLSPHAEVEWEHEYEDSPDSITARFLADPTATPFQINGDKVDTNYFKLGLGVSFTWPKGKSGFIYYEKTLGITGLTQDNLTLGFRMEF